MNDTTSADLVVQPTTASNTLLRVLEDPVAVPQARDFTGLNDAVSYVNRVEATCGHKKSREWLELLQAYQLKKLPMQQLLDGVHIMFQKYQDLWTGFNDFIPEDALAEH